MKKYFIYAASALALAACSSDEYIGEVNEAQLGSQNGAIMFTSINPSMTRAQQVGADAAKTLGGNFIVEGVKCAAADTKFSAGNVVFDNYLVGWGANTAGKTEDNTNDWKYVDVTGTTNCPASVLTALDRTATKQTIKYWDYSANNYQFIAFSTGARTMLASGDPESGNSIGVTKIDKTNYALNAYTFNIASAADLGQCFYTDVNTVEKSAFGAPVKLVFKNMGAKLRIGLYETVPGYNVKNVRFYSAEPTTLGEGATTTAALYARLANLPASGTIKVFYDANGIAKADVTAGATKGANVTLGDFAATEIGTSLSTATYSAGAPANDAKFTSVFPATNASALTLKVDYTLESTDGTGETINVYGANAVVPATYTTWLPNYAYTYVFKISDNTNGLTDPTNTDKVGLFPITFDAVVADITEGTTAEQTTVTTVATPSVTTYQKGHTKDSEYKAGDIYVQVMQGSDLAILTDKATLYTITDANATEADVIDALQMGITSGNVTTGRNGLALTKLSSLSTDVTKVPMADETDKTVASGRTAKFAAASSTYYVFVYDFTTTATPSDLYSYDETASTGANAPSDWKADATNPYYTKNVDGTYTQVTTDWATGTYYKKYTNNGNNYAVKIIKVGA